MSINNNHNNEVLYVKCFIYKYNSNYVEILVILFKHKHHTKPSLII